MLKVVLSFMCCLRVRVWIDGLCTTKLLADKELPVHTTMIINGFPVWGRVSYTKQIIFSLTIKLDVFYRRNCSGL